MSEKTRQVQVGSVRIGGGAPVAVQSMCNTHTSDAHATIEQIARLHDAGCEIIRLAVPDQAAADALPEIVRAAPIPVVADIHFDYRLALAAAKAGVHKIRINPGNIGEPDNVRKVAEACRERGIPIRIGVNGGSLEKRLLEKYGHPTPEALVESAQGHIDLLHRYDFDDIALSMKSSTVPLTIAAYRLAAERFTSVSRRPARRITASSAPPSASARCCPRASAIRSASRSRLTPWRRCAPASPF